MFFYEDKIPERRTIVIANTKIDDKNDNCMYVTLPEYGNVEGILYRNELPKRLKQQKKAIADMKHAGQIVCIVTSDSNTSTGYPAQRASCTTSCADYLQSANTINTNLIELSIRGVDTKYHELILTRYRNIEKILKIMKFISITFKIPYYDLVNTIQKSIITPLKEIDENNSVDNYELLYNSCLRDITSFLKFVPLVNNNNELREQVITSLNPLIRETNASSSLMFDVFVWKGDSAGRNAVTILQSLFSDIKTNFKNVDIRYIGAPRYQISLRSVAIESIDNIYSDIKTSMINFMTTNNVTCYDLQFDSSQKEVVHGNVTITFPSHIEMIDQTN